MTRTATRIFVVQVREALVLAYDSHSGQDRKSGEPYITHPVEVTRILAELKMDHESLIAGLLHDTVEDTDVVSFEEIGVRAMHHLRHQRWLFSWTACTARLAQPLRSAHCWTATWRCPSTSDGRAGDAEFRTGAQVWFGPAVRRIVEGETKFSKIGNLAGASDANGSMDLKAMDLQQLFLAMTEEVSGRASSKKSARVAM